MSNRGSHGADPLHHGLDASTGEASHGHKPGWMRNHAGFRRSCPGQQLQQRGPERILRLILSPTFGDITGQRLATFPLGESGYFLRRVIFRAQHGGTKPQCLRMIRQRGIQQRDGHLRIRELFPRNSGWGQRFSAMVIVTSSLNRQPFQVSSFPHPQTPRLPQQRRHMRRHSQFGRECWLFRHAFRMPRIDAEVKSFGTQQPLRDGS
jgi:hypothetical protein